MMTDFGHSPQCPHCQQMAQSLARVNALLLQLSLDYQNQLADLEKVFLDFAAKHQAQTAQLHQMRQNFYISLKQAKREFHKDYALIASELAGLSVSQPVSPVPQPPISDSDS